MQRTAGACVTRVMSTERKERVYRFPLVSGTPPSRFFETISTPPAWWWWSRGWWVAANALLWIVVTLAIVLPIALTQGRDASVRHVH